MGIGTIRQNENVETVQNLATWNRNWIKVHENSEDVYTDLTGDDETRFDTSSHEVERPLSIGKNKKVIRIMKDELSGRIMKNFCWVETEDMYLPSR